MAGLIATNGLQRAAVQTSQATSGSGPTYSASRHVQVMSVDDGTAALAAGHTAANSGGAITNFFDKAFSGAPTRSGQVVSHVCTFTDSEAVFTHKRILLHDDTAANVTSSSATLFGGVDGQSFVKPNDISLTYTLQVTYSV